MMLSVCIVYTYMYIFIDIKLGTYNQNHLIKQCSNGDSVVYIKVYVLTALYGVTKYPSHTFNDRVVLACSPHC